MWTGRHREIFLLINIARKLIELQKMYSLAPLEWPVTIQIVCFVVDSNYYFFNYVSTSVKIWLSTLRQRVAHH